MSSDSRTSSRERLALVFGVEGGGNVNPVHALARDMLWCLLWYLNNLFGEGVREGGASGFQKQLAFLRSLKMVMAVVGFRYDEDKTEDGLLNIFFSDASEKKDAMIQVANALTDRKLRVIHRPMQFDPDSGMPEMPAMAARRLLREAVLHQNRVIAASYVIHRNALVDAGILTDQEAEEILTEALIERGKFAGEISASCAVC